MDKSNDQNQKAWPEKYIMGGISLVTIVISITLMTLVFRLREARMKNLSPKETTRCFRCDMVDIDPEHLPETVIQKISTHRDGSLNICCGAVSVFIDLLVQKALSQKDTTLTPSIYSLVSDECKTTRKVKPAAKMSGLALNEIVKDSTSIVYWNTSSPPFLKNGTRYQHGKLTVYYSGYYFIFSQIRHKISRDSNVTQSHKVYKRPSSSNDHEILLEDARTGCMDMSDNQAWTSSVGAVFYLDANDEIYVTASHPGDLLPSAEANFFGLYMV